MKQYFEKFESVTEFIHTIDTRNEIASRLNGVTKWHKAFKSLVK